MHKQFLKTIFYAGREAESEKRELTALGRPTKLNPYEKRKKWKKKPVELPLVLEQFGHRFNPSVEHRAHRGSQTGKAAC